MNICIYIPTEEDSKEKSIIILFQYEFKYLRHYLNIFWKIYLSFVFRHTYVTILMRFRDRASTIMFKTEPCHLWKLIKIHDKNPLKFGQPKIYHMADN